MVSLFLVMQVSTHQFPADFIGDWSGTMMWSKAGAQEPQKVPMRLKIAKLSGADTYTYQLSYGENAKDNRPYEMKLVDKAKGHWQVDEKNGIVLDHYWVGDAFVGVFTVGGNTIVAKDRREGDTLVTEMITNEAMTLTTSGGKDGIPAVTTHRILSVQRAVLKKNR